MDAVTKELIACLDEAIEAAEIFLDFSKPSNEFMYEHWVAAIFRARMTPPVEHCDKADPNIKHCYPGASTDVIISVAKAE